jgi:hypothetical protein
VRICYSLRLIENVKFYLVKTFDIYLIVLFVVEKRGSSFWAPRASIILGSSAHDGAGIYVMERRVNNKFSSAGNLPPFTMALDPMANLAQAENITGLSKWTLKRLGKRGELTIIKLSPRRVGIRMSELQRFLDARSQMS